MKMFIHLVIVSVLFCLATCARRENIPPSRPGAVYTVADFYKNLEYRGASFSYDEKRILVSSNLSGIWNAYAIPTGGGEPEALTQSKTNSIFAASYFPNDLRFLYLSDEGGNERSHIY